MWSFLGEKKQFKDDEECNFGWGGQATETLLQQSMMEEREENTRITMHLEESISNHLKLCLMFMALGWTCADGASILNGP